MMPEQTMLILNFLKVSLSRLSVSGTFWQDMECYRYSGAATNISFFMHFVLVS